VKLGRVEGDSQPTCDRFVGDAVCHRSKYFELAGGYPSARRPRRCHDRYWEKG
jgi:hypothetical protein